MDYNTIMAQKSADTKSSLDEQKKKDDEHKAKLNDRSYYDKLKADINSGAHANWDQATNDDWLIVNKRFNGPTNSAMQKQSDDLSSQMPLVPTSEDVTAATGATPEEQVAASQETQKIASEKPTDTEALQGVVTEGETAAQNAGSTADARTQAIQDALKDRYGAIEDYYSGSMSDAWKSLNPTDKKILLLDQLGTTLKNVSKARLPMYSAYGRNYEGEGFGDEKSMLQKTMEDSLQKGLDRRNARLDSQMQKQLQVANFPADLEMQLTGMWESGKMSNRQKVHLIKMMSNVNFVDALKAGAVSIAANGGIIDKASGALLGRL